MSKEDETKNKTYHVSNNIKINETEPSKRIWIFVYICGKGSCCYHNRSKADMLLYAYSTHANVYMYLHMHTVRVHYCIHKCMFLCTSTLEFYIHFTSNMQFIIKFDFYASTSFLPQQAFSLNKLIYY